MGACDKLTFNNVDQNKADCVAKAVNAKTGIPIGMDPRWNPELRVGTLSLGITIHSSVA